VWIKAEAGLNNICSLKSSPEGLQAVSAVVESFQDDGTSRAELLELRTEGGPVYLRPSGWQRFWLQRAFRHFRVLPPQLLSRSNQRRIADLLQTSVVTPEKPIPNSKIFGVVAQVHGKSPAAVFGLGQLEAKPVKTLALVPTLVPQKSAPVELQTALGLEKSAGFSVQENGLWRWIVAGVAAAACIPLIMVSVYGISLLSSPPQVSSHPASTPVQQAVAAIPPAAAAPAPAVVPEKRKRRVTSNVAQPALVQASGAPATVPARFVSELPPGHFAYPVVTTGGLAGEVRLKATIDADGTVKQVTVLSGNPKLAEAAMQAVRRWHYSPYGEPVPAETEIRMKFFGPDAVSIASVAASPAS
jgi:TonB family protein